ncbi:hypothetical protein GCM10011512_07740 [Tersicoccus solisilvae]|uniref:Bacterial mobilisation domain-containing protein n=1 Tax=Tersicoccus solisilvae TaxID=1882339 RepID=A0ABQ1NV23_9MICC|nr:plasmid mobilization relaxosome protein MobC [Tersicoccus solisilvae]GGC83436.1 hypothetical protein GCM10011512_07740 [Tersicoccus solisilvae]
MPGESNRAVALAVLRFDGGNELIIHSMKARRREQLGELLAMRRLMATIANNVNQLAKHANQTGEVPAEAAATLRIARTFGEEALAKLEEYRL